MTNRSLFILRILGIGHIVVSILLLPYCILLGYTQLPLVAIGLIWLIILGIKLMHPRPGLRNLLRNTHVVVLIQAVYLIAFGIMTLQGASRSAETGGGLMGAFGLIPLGIGIGRGCFVCSFLVRGFYGTKK